LDTRARFLDGPDLAELGAHLASGRVPPGTFDLSGLDGFLAAVAVGPEWVPPDEWLPTIWGAGGSPFTDEAQAFRLFDAIYARLDQIVRQLEEDPDAYTPIFRTTDDGVAVATEWARGFLDGVQLRPAAWAPLTATQEGMRFFVIITSQLPDWDEQVRAASGSADADIAAFRREGQKLIPDSVVAIGRFWKRQHGGRRAAGRFS
jgi:uncharacterized protein